MPEFSLPKEMTDVPSPLWPDELPAPAAPAAASAPPATPPTTAMGDTLPPLANDFGGFAPMDFGAPADAGASAAPSPIVDEVTPPEEPTQWSIPVTPPPAPRAPAPTAPPAPAAAPAPEALWNSTPPPPAPATARPTVTVRRAQSAPTPVAGNERTGEWSLSGSHEVPTAPREEITQEVPLRPVETPRPAPGAAPIVRRAAAPAPKPAAPAAPATPAAPAADGGIWSASGTVESDDDRTAVLRHRLAMVEQYLQKATADFSQGAISEAMWQEETERWSLERVKLVRELAQLMARKRPSDAA
jgi:hypothetical protein